MNSTEYEENALKTEAPIDEAMLTRLQNPETIRMLHAGIGFATETGEFLDALKKHIFYGAPIDKVNLREEVGDLFWYAAIAVNALKTSIPAEMQRNIDKLSFRYPEKFSSEASENRDLEGEREILEAEYHVHKDDDSIDKERED
jgi:NTP pyrophosphatase (non-canonical NTP hydrolase)